MNKGAGTLFVVALLSASLCQAQPKHLFNETAVEKADRMAWWTQARFGMFIHWGLYSILGREAWAMGDEDIPLAEYEKLTQQFQPKPNAARKNRAGVFMRTQPILFMLHAQTGTRRFRQNQIRQSGSSG